MRGRNFEERYLDRQRGEREKIRSAKSERVARGRRVPGQRASARANSGGDGRDRRRWQRAARLGFCISALSRVRVFSDVFKKCRFVF